MNRPPEPVLQRSPSSLGRPVRLAVAAWLAVAVAILGLGGGLLACGPTDGGSEPRGQEDRPTVTTPTSDSTSTATVDPTEDPADDPTNDPSAGPDRAFLRVLGTVQDGGLPHAACRCDRCERARRDPAHRRHVASLALVVPGAGPDGEDGAPEVYLVDATPDVRPQLDRLADLRRPAPGRVDRRPVDGIFLTHAHIGHYLGLAFFGYEAIHSRELPLWATPSLLSFLETNGPWSQLVELGNVAPRPLAPGERVTLGADGPAPVTVTALAVPHRDEFADTVGFAFEGPNRRVLYVPDTDSWDAWGERFEEVVSGLDVALVDATFFSGAELPGREVAQIGHPLIVDSLERFAPWTEAGRLEVLFTHLNHSNPALDPASPERRRVDERRGFAVLEEGREIGL